MFYFLQLFFSILLNPKTAFKNATVGDFKLGFSNMLLREIFL